MGTNADKRTRQRQNRDAARAAMGGGRKVDRRVQVMAVLAVAAILIGLLVVFTAGGGDDTADSTTTTTAAPAAGDKAELPAPPEGITLTEATPCPPAEGSEQRVQKFAGAPPTCIDPAMAYSATINTTEGSFTAALDTETAPVAANNFVVLSRFHFYDGVPVHRIVPGFVIQAGDGDGDPWGSNDLGYTLPDELPASAEAYTDYSLAMANSGPNTGGSQFFVVLPGGGAQLGPLYTRFGEVTEGREVVDAIGALGNAQQEPTKAVVIESVEITETPR